MQVQSFGKHHGPARHDGRHGLSLYIGSGAKLLFDMGQTDLFAKERHGVDEAVDLAFLSTGTDHGGGWRFWN